MEGLIVLLLVMFIVLPIIPYWVLYSRCGKPGWACLIPIYNTIVLLDIVKKPAWWFLLLLIPFINFIMFIIVMERLSKCFGHSSGFTIGLIFLPFIFVPILAFGGNKYIPLES